MKVLAILAIVILAVIGAVLAQEEDAAECSPICTLEYNPICGIDARGYTETFGNPCEFDYYNCVHRNAPMRMLRHAEC